MDERVYQAFQAFEEPIRERLLDLREVIYDVASTTDGVGHLEETLKWGEISYLNPAGTTLRIGTVKGSDQLAMYVHCQTTIVDSLRESTDLEFEGTRCIKLPEGDIDTDDVRLCIRQALTYKLVDSNELDR